MSGVDHNLWVEKFRPKTCKQIILPSKVRRIVNKIISSKVLPNLILFDHRPGTGKTSLAKCLCNDLEAEYLYINGSLSANIDLLRNDIKAFCSTWSIESNFKVVIIDDIGSNSTAFQNALKVFVEEYSKTCRFIITTNSLSYIIKPLKESRFEVIEYNYDDPKVKDELLPTIKKAFAHLLKKMEIPFSENGLNQLIENSYPDLRWCLRSLQVEYIENGQITEDIIKLVNLDKEFYQLILDKKLTDTRKYLIEKGADYGELYTKMFDEFIPLIPSKAIQAQCILKVEYYMNNHVSSINPEITFTAMLIDIMSIL